MHVEQRTGQVPGSLYATIRHGTTARTLCVEVECTRSGRFIARMPNQQWSPECATIDNAILLHAAVVFPTDIETSPWLANRKPVSAFSFPRRTYNRAPAASPPIPEPATRDIPITEEASCVSMESA